MNSRLATAGVLLVLAAGCRQDTLEPRDTGSAAAPPVAAATAPVFRQLTSGLVHSCAVAEDGRAYCWGNNNYGQLGTGVYGGPESCLGWFCSPLPVAAAADLRFRQVTAGAYHTCGITTDDQAFCWGGNTSGQLGDGTTQLYQLIPVPVAGGLTFAQLDAGSSHTCGVTTTDRRAYCWGSNSSGELGNRTTLPSSVPVAVEGLRRYRLVSAGGSHTCGVSELNRAFCWGNNRSGQVGDGSQVRGRLRPVLVAGGHAFLQVDAGGSGGTFGHSCGVTTDRQALCWGNGQYGQLGDGAQHNVFIPAQVVGGLELRRVTAGEAHTCGETVANEPYCWGSNIEGQLGDGTTSGPFVCGILQSGCHAEPVVVSGDRRFRQMSLGSFHTCGVNRNGVAFCWGNNLYGQLGDGTENSRLSPTRVRNPV